MRFAAVGASDGISISNQLFEFRSAIVTDIFVNRHFRWLPQGAFFLILAQNAMEWMPELLAEDAKRLPWVPNDSS